MHARPMAAGLTLVGMLAATGCAASPGAQAPSSSDAPVEQSLGSVRPAPPEGEVIGTGTVMDVDGEVELCLGPVLASYPPQCGGIPLEDWSWEGLEGSESSGSVRWGAYAVTGTFDGTVLTLTQNPAMLALFDPPIEDPTGGVAGATAEAELDELVQDVSDRFADDPDMFLGAYPDNGYAWIEVVWDDGTLQQAADEEFGSDAVVIVSRLRAID